MATRKANIIGNIAAELEWELSENQTSVPDDAFVKDFGIYYGINDPKFAKTVYEAEQELKVKIARYWLLSVDERNGHYDQDHVIWSQLTKLRREISTDIETIEERIDLFGKEVQ